MALELYIWGPAFGLPSIDPDCLAAVAYLSLAAPCDAWTVVATSPSAVPHPLPALRDVQSGCWVASGFEALVAYLRRSSASSSPTSAAFVDLDAGLTPAQAADATAYAAFLRADAAPLLALSLYVSSANWAATTRPAYSRLLPFPLTWLEPPALRAAHTARAAGLGLSHIDADAEAGGGGGGSAPPPAAALVAEDAATEESASPLTAALNAFPNRLRPSLRPTAAALAASGGTPAARSQARLDAAARACLDVLARRKGRKRLFLRGRDEEDNAAPPAADAPEEPEPDSGAERPTSLDCLAFGYLALMAVPAVPRPFLRDALHRHHLGLAVFVADMRRLCAESTEGAGAVGTARLWRPQPPPAPAKTSKGAGGAAVAAAATAATATPPPPAPLAVVSRPALRPLWLRTVDGLVHSVPGAGGVCLVWLWRQLGVASGAEDEADEEDGALVAARQRRRLVQRLLALGAAAAGTALVVGLAAGYRRLPPFGAPVLVYRRVPRTLVGMGMAGAMLSVL